MIYSIRVAPNKYGMTKKLTELFNLPPSDDDKPVTMAEAADFVAENQDIINSVDDAIDKIDVALPQVKDLDSVADTELDDLASLAKEKAQDLLDLGMNVDPRFAGVILQTASTMFGHAITAKTAKMDKKLRMISLQLQKARLDHQIAKDSKNKDDEDDEEPIDGKGLVLDRTQLLAQLLEMSKKQ
jgi:hypothetical protein